MLLRFTEEPPPPLQSDDPEMRENQQSTDELSLELAAEALTRVGYPVPAIN